LELQYTQSLQEFSCIYKYQNIKGRNETFGAITSVPNVTAHLMQYSQLPDLYQYDGIRDINCGPSPMEMPANQKYLDDS
jgi:hypothetical protein